MKADIDWTYLNKEAANIRKMIIQYTEPDKTYHFGGALSVVEIIVYLYFHVLDKDLYLKDRDKVILSKGHACTALYAVLASQGYLKNEELYTYKKINSLLQAHPDMTRIPCIDFSTGSLGQGLSVGTGMAKGFKMNNSFNKVYVVLGDGELQEGQNWEAAMSAAKFKLDNLICFIDCNKLQVDGKVEDIMPLGEMADKWKAFGWHVLNVNGHDLNQIHNAFIQCVGIANKPKIIVCDTIKGKGVSFMENRQEWHSKCLPEHLKMEALHELEEFA